MQLNISKAFDFSTGTPRFRLVESDFDEINEMVDELTWILFELEENNINQTREASQLFCIDCNRDDIFCLCLIGQLDQPYPVQLEQPGQLDQPDQQNFLPKGGEDDNSSLLGRISVEPNHVPLDVEGELPLNNHVPLSIHDKLDVEVELPLNIPYIDKSNFGLNLELPLTIPYIDKSNFESNQVPPAKLEIVGELPLKIPYIGLNQNLVNNPYPSKTAGKRATFKIVKSSNLKSKMVKKSISSKLTSRQLMENIIVAALFDYKKRKKDNERGRCIYCKLCTAGLVLSPDSERCVGQNRI